VLRFCVDPQGILFCCAHTPAEILLQDTGHMVILSMLTDRLECPLQPEATQVTQLIGTIGAQNETLHRKISEKSALRISAGDTYITECLLNYHMGSLLQVF